MTGERAGATAAIELVRIDHLQMKPICPPMILIGSASKVGRSPRRPENGQLRARGAFHSFR
jgi:hypothetical protein